MWALKTMDRRATDKNKSRPDTAAPSAAEIRTQLAKIAGSPGFQKATRLREFLRFVVNGKLDGRADNLKAYTIGLEAVSYTHLTLPTTSALCRSRGGRGR